MSESFKKARPVIVAGFSSKKLGQGIADYMGCKNILIRDKEHADGEIEPAVMENVRGREVILVASSAGDPNKQIFETQLLEDSLRSAGAKKVTLVIPYMWYGRSDSNFSERKSTALRIAIKNVSDCDNVIVADPHNSVLTREMFLVNRVNALNLSFAHSFATQLTNLFNEGAISKERLMFLHPDAGSTKRIDTAFRSSLYKAIGLNTEDARWNPNGDSWPQIGKNRDKQTNESKTKDINVDVNGMDVVIFEDMVASGGTACDLAAALKQHGARSVTLFATHGLFTPKREEKKNNKTASVDRINNSQLDYVFVTNSYDHEPVDVEIHDAIVKSPKIHVVDIAPYLGAVLEAIHLDVYEDTPDDANSVSAIMRGNHIDQAKMAMATPLKSHPAHTERELAIA